MTSRQKQFSSSTRAVRRIHQNFLFNVAAKTQASSVSDIQYYRLSTEIKFYIHTSLLPPVQSNGKNQIRGASHANANDVLTKTAFNPTEHQTEYTKPMKKSEDLALAGQLHGLDTSRKMQRGEVLLCHF